MNRRPVSEQLKDLNDALHCTPETAPAWLKTATQAYALGDELRALRIIDAECVIYCCLGRGDISSRLIGLVNTLDPVPQFLRVA